MDDKPKDSGKLKLRNTDTNRFKVDTGRLRVQPTPEVASEISKQGAGETQKNAAFVDPISLRDTSTSKLKRLDGQGTLGSTTITPASGAAEKKTETVRLKVVRATPRPGTMPPSAAPLANMPLSAPPETEKQEAPAPVAAVPLDSDMPAEAPKLTIPQIKMPPRPDLPDYVKPGATTSITPDFQPEPIVGEEVSPAAAKISLQVPAAVIQVPQEAPPAAQVPEAKPFASATQGIPTDTSTLQTVTPSKPPAEAVPSSTIKLTMKKPAGVPLPEPGSSPAPAPAPQAQQVTPAPPKLPSTATTGLKIRPSATSGSTVVTPAPGPDSGQTAAVAPPPAAGATVKVSPSAIVPASGAAKISLKKEAAAEPAVAPAPAAEPATSSSSTVAVKTPVPETPAKSTGKGLKLSGKAGKTVSVPAPGSSAKTPEGEPADASAKAEAAASVVQTGARPLAGISMLEGVSALVAAVALAVTVFSLLMSLLKQL